MLIDIIVTLIIVGVLLWAVNSIIPMDPKIKQIVQVVVVVAVCLWLLGILTGHAPGLYGMCGTWRR